MDGTIAASSLTTLDPTYVDTDMTQGVTRLGVVAGSENRWRFAAAANGADLNVPAASGHQTAQFVLLNGEVHYPLQINVPPEAQAQFEQMGFRSGSTVTSQDTNNPNGFRVTFGGGNIRIESNTGEPGVFNSNSRGFTHFNLIEPQASLGMDNLPSGFHSRRDSLRAETAGIPEETSPPAATPATPVVQQVAAATPQGAAPRMSPPGM